eukprot:tig00000789_g4126.t1
MLLIRRATLLRGEQFSVCTGDIVIENGRIARLRVPPTTEPEDSAAEQEIDGDGLIVIPAFANAHCHVLDSQLKERWVGYSIPELFLRSGWKYRTLSEASEDELRASARQAISQMVDYGVLTAAVFVEEGARGLRAVRSACEGTGMHEILLGELQEVENEGADAPDVLVEELAELGDGFGPCSSTGLADSLLERFREAARRRAKLTCTHMAEFAETKSFDRALDLLGVRFLVHCNYLSEAQLAILAKRNVGIVCCIRSGSTFGERTPDLAELSRLGVRFALATDNVFTNTPDLFRELEFVTRKHMMDYKGKPQISPEALLRAATVDACRLLGIERRGLVEEGYSADLIVLQPDSNLQPFCGAISIILRAGVHHIKHVISSGKIVRTFPPRPQH